MHEGMHYYTGEFFHRDYRTWYRVTPGAEGLDSGKAPLICLHGGPGAGHDYLLPYADLAVSGRTVIHYDQIGCGRSTHFPREGVDFFTIDRFLEQLDALIKHLGIREYHLLGHSWGGMLAVEHAIRQPSGLKSLTIASAPPSVEAWERTARELWRIQNPDQQHALEEADRTGDLSGKEFLAAKDEYYRLHLGDFGRNKPACLAASDAESNHDGHTYELMWGPYEFMVKGSLHDWDRTNDLSSIKVPTLVMAGEHDQVNADTIAPFMTNIPKVTSRWIPNSSHVPHLENPETALLSVSDFLTKND